MHLGRAVLLGARRPSEQGRRPGRRKAHHAARAAAAASTAVGLYAVPEDTPNTVGFAPGFVAARGRPVDGLVVPLETGRGFQVVFGLEVHRRGGLRIPRRAGRIRGRRRRPTPQPSTTRSPCALRWRGTRSARNHPCPVIAVGRRPSFEALQDGARQLGFDMKHNRSAADRGESRGSCTSQTRKLLSEERLRARGGHERAAGRAPCRRAGGPRGTSARAAAAEVHAAELERRIARFGPAYEDDRAQIEHLLSELEERDSELAELRPRFENLETRNRPVGRRAGRAGPPPRRAGAHA